MFELIRKNNIQIKMYKMLCSRRVKCRLDGEKRI
jgi:hypothetical protein